MVKTLNTSKSGGGPAFYKKLRLTKDDKPFELIKFRSMRVDAEKDGVALLFTENHIICKGFHSNMGDSCQKMMDVHSE